MDRFVLRLFDMRNSLLLCKQFLFWFLLFGFLSFLDFIFHFDFTIDLIIYVFFLLLVSFSARTVACVHRTPQRGIQFVHVPVLFRVYPMSH